MDNYGIQLEEIHQQQIKDDSLSYINVNLSKVQLPPCLPVTLAFANLSYSVDDATATANKQTSVDLESSGQQEPGRKFLLKQLSGIVRPGELLAVMGPSGCGKTTFLDLLARRIKSGYTNGVVHVNGQYLKDKQFRNVSAYVPQEDSLIGDFTVKETLMYAADFWLKESTAEKETRVEHLIRELGLESAKDTYIGTVFKKGISGGQKRRVSLGVELISNPSLLFLDEPTSGLDSAAAFNIMLMLRRLCQAGHTVICTIHQPSSEVFHLCDKVMLLSKGHQVYLGPAKEMEEYFSRLGHQCPPSTNPADFVLNLLNTDFPTHGDLGKLIASFKLSKSTEQIQGEIASIRTTDSPSSNDEKPNIFDECVILLRRGFQYILRNPGIYWVRLAMYIMLALMLGTLFFRMKFSAKTIQDRISLLFFIAAFMVFMSVAVLPQFLLDKPVFVRERAGGSYGPAAYVFAQTLVSIPGILLIAVVASTIVYWMCRLNPQFVRFVWFTLNLFLSLFVAEGLIHVISALVPFFIIGLVAAAGIYGGFMLTEGFFLVRGNIPKWWIWMYYIGFHSYSFESFMYNEFSDATFTYSAGSPWSVSLNDTVTGMDVLKLYEMGSDHRARDMLILAGMAVAYRVAYYVVLKVWHTGKR